MRTGMRWQTGTLWIASSPSRSSSKQSLRGELAPEGVDQLVGRGAGGVDGGGVPDRAACVITSEADSSGNFGRMLASRWNQHRSGWRRGGRR